MATSVKDVKAQAPVASSGGKNPKISLSGVVPVDHGGTGINLATDPNGTKSGWLLTADGGGLWTLQPPADVSYAIYHDSGTPDPILGADGDFYLDVQNPSDTYLYGPKTNGAWGSGVPLVGPAGANSTVVGPQGTQQGIKGNVGDKGAQGDKGPSGTNFTLKGSRATFNLLPSSGNADGDAYLIDDTKELWVWGLPNPNQWNNLGNLRSAKGLTGDPSSVNGAPGKNQTVYTNATPPAFIGSPLTTPFIITDANQNITLLDELPLQAAPALHAASHKALNGIDPVTIEIPQINNLSLTGYMSLSGDQTISGDKSFTAFPVLPSSNPIASEQAANKSYLDSSTFFVSSQISSKANASNTMLKSGNQTVTGLKTFLTNPECNSPPVGSNDLANKGYVDSQFSNLLPSKLLSTTSPAGTGLFSVAIQFKTSDILGSAFKGSGKLFSGTASMLGPAPLGFSGVVTTGNIAGRAYKVTPSSTRATGLTVTCPDFTKTSTLAPGIFLMMWFRLDEDRTDWWTGSVAPVSGVAPNELNTRQLIVGLPIANASTPTTIGHVFNTTAPATGLPSFAICLAGKAGDPTKPQRLTYEYKPKSGGSPVVSDLLKILPGDRSWHHVAFLVDANTSDVWFWFDGVVKGGPIYGIGNDIKALLPLNTSLPSGATVCIAGGNDSGLSRATSFCQYTSAPISVSQLYIDCTPSVNATYYNPSYVKAAYAIGFGVPSNEL